MELSVKFLVTSIILVMGFTCFTSIFDGDYLNNEKLFYLCRGGIIASLIGFFASLVWVVWK